jgi:hypothetical protein
VRSKSCSSALESGATNMFAERTNREIAKIFEWMSLFAASIDLRSRNSLVFAVDFLSALPCTRHVFAQT